MSFTAYNLSVSCQLNLGTNESPDIVDISDVFLSGSTSHGAEQTNGTCSVVLTELPGDAESNIDLLLYGGWGGSTDALFYGPIIGRERNLDGTVTLTAQDRLAWLSYPWQKDTRIYVTDPALPATATDNSIIQNLVEAAAVPVSLTHIEGEDLELGIVAEILLQHGDRAFDLIKKINEATPLYDIYTVGNGGVWRRKREYRSSVATLTELYQATRLDQDITAIKNAIKVTGGLYLGEPAVYETQADSSWIGDPPKYFGMEVNNELIETGPADIAGVDGTTRAEIVGDALLAYHNQPGDRVSVSFRGNGDIKTGDTVTITAARLGLSGAERYVLDVRHQISRAQFVTTITGLKL